jgi:acyl-CoA synthetase (AMP-forming)/AMP-acid ligase II
VTLFHLADLPSFTFVSDPGEERLDLAQCGGRIQAIADRVEAAFAPGASVGLVFPSGPRLVLAWLGVLHAGRVPCILHYPTEKLSKEYWRESIGHTVGACGIAGLVHGPDLAAAGLERLAPVLVLDGGEGERPFRGEFPEAGEILQLSSGTTGFKKGIPFTFDDLAGHARAYGQVLGLGRDDRIVSWLPLYHDMGFVACFLMPLMLGMPVVMMDPIVWVRRPALLFEAAARHRATICFLPNFAFEVMARQAPVPALPAMRRWISCSEPVYLESLERFQAATGAAPDTLCACYAMAENVFAVAQSAGLETVVLDGLRRVSCGRPIPGTEVRVVDGEIRVRSSHSLRAYVGGDDARDADGFYGTGDLGELVDGALVVTGRKRDLVNVGGQKFMLNDLDLQAGRVFPECAGRIAALARFDPALGTERVLFLLELERFWEWRLDPAAGRALAEATGLEGFECRAVPPFFITKTSSGKINRAKSLADWERVGPAEKGPGTAAGPDLVEDLASFAAALPQDRPLAEVMDSMGLVIMRLVCEDHGLVFDPRATLAQLRAAAPVPATGADGRVFSIVALMDGIKLGWGADWKLVDPPFLDTLALVVGCPVTFEHLTVPPLPVLMSDLIFHDYFLPRAGDNPAYSAFAECIGKIKRASLLLLDDEDNFRLPLFCVYPQLDHRFTHHGLAGYLGHRFTRYTLKHHLLPRQPVLGAEMKPQRVLQALADLRTYLGIPVMTLAFHLEYQAHTGDWDYREYRPYVSDADYMARPVDLARVRTAILAFAERHRDRRMRSPGAAETRFIMKDPPHFCSFLVNPKAVDWVLTHYESFCIMGVPSSVPFLDRALEALGKPYFRSPTLTPPRDDFDCVIMTGASGEPVTTRPVFDLVHAGGTSGRPRNVSYATFQDCPLFMFGAPDLLRQLREECLDMVPLGNYCLNGGRLNCRPEFFNPGTPL